MLYSDLAECFALCQPPNKQLQRTVKRRRGDAASAPFHYARAPRITRQRAAAELRRYTERDHAVLFAKTKSAHRRVAPRELDSSSQLERRNHRGARASSVKLRARPRIAKRARW